MGNGGISWSRCSIHEIRGIGGFFVVLCCLAGASGWCRAPLVLGVGRARNRSKSGRSLLATRLTFDNRLQGYLATRRRPTLACRPVGSARIPSRRHCPGRDPFSLYCSKPTRIWPTAQSRHGGVPVQAIAYRLTPPFLEGRSSITAPHLGQYSTSPFKRPSSSSRWQAAQSDAPGTASRRSAAIIFPQEEQAAEPGQSPWSSRAGPVTKPVAPHSGQANRPAAARKTSYRTSRSCSPCARSFPALRSHRRTVSGPHSSVHEHREHRSSR